MGTSALMTTQARLAGLPEPMRLEEASHFQALHLSLSFTKAIPEILDIRDGGGGGNIPISFVILFRSL